MPAQTLLAVMAATMAGGGQPSGYNDSGRRGGSDAMRFYGAWSAALMSRSMNREQAAISSSE